VNDGSGALFPDDVPRDARLVEDPGLVLDQAVVLTATANPWRRALRRLRRDTPAMIALAFLVVVVVLAFLAPVLLKSPSAISSDKFQKPSWGHPLGTDYLGRDTLARIAYGAQVSLRSGFQIVGIALLIAVPVGLVSGFRGGGLDFTIMRVLEGLASFPPLVLALAVVGLLGAGMQNAILAISLVMIPGFARLIRAQTLAVREETFIDASRAMGTRAGRIRWRRVLPNVASPMIVAVSLAIGFALIAEAQLSLLGYGVQRPTASWGGMIQDARIDLLQHPWQVFIPSLALVFTILAFNTLGDGIRDALGMGLPKGKQAVKGRLGVTTVTGATAGPSAGDALLTVSDLSVEFVTDAGPVTVVDRVSFAVRAGEVVGLVGESGSGKTVSSLAVMRLVPSPPGRVTGGAVTFDGRDVLAMSMKELRTVRGNEIAMMFQDPMTSLNPAFTIGTQLVDTIRLHHRMSRRDARARAVELLALTGIPDPQRRLRDYPHQLSGGMRQRALLALALSCEPRMLIADEPTTALDVTVQAQILDLLRALQARLGMGVLFVTHDLGVVANLCSRVVVMYAGQVVEEAPVDELFARPRHPYTEGLLGAIPQVTATGERLASIPGVVPTAAEMPTGCRFHPRCPYAVPACATTEVELTAVGDGHRTRCIRTDEVVLKGAR